jgi:hypothetical protein
LLRRDAEWADLANTGKDLDKIVSFWSDDAILDTSKLVRIAVDWLLRSDIGEVIKTIVHDEEHFPDYRIPKKIAAPEKKRRR